MLTLFLRRALTHKLPAGPRLPARLTPSCGMGTHGRNEPREPLSSPKGAKEFIYRLQPAERSSLLRELQSFESTAIAQ
ncbi:transmembrane protein 65-like, partial [Plectropomus leopardus]|uniref:transmembrane protein 65-like n=1 Tax=Plectropomus leopardus TaxID=160734 RepID=UPI001C4A8C2A